MEGMKPWGRPCRRWMELRQSRDKLVYVDRQRIRKELISAAKSLNGL